MSLLLIPGLSRLILILINQDATPLPKTHKNLLQRQAKGLKYVIVSVSSEKTCSALILLTRNSHLGILGLLPAKLVIRGFFF